uniref:CARD domain-containing protein n=1 Tax=Seriola lalandi dorsalis TaxID=1841481 RepID=A0A3B4WYH5_SERLL
MSGKKKLKSVRTQFIDRVSEPVLHKLLDKLLERGVITEGEMERVVTQSTRADKARVVIDTVRKKGSEASSVLIAALCEEDSCLFNLEVDSVDCENLSCFDSLNICIFTQM